MKFLKKHSRLIIYTVLLTLALILPTLVFADDATGTSTWTDMLRKMTTLISFSYYIAYPMIWVCAVFIGLFLDNEFLLGGGIQDIILSIWRMVRDLVNIGFVGVLLIIALYNATGISIGSADSLDYKQSLKKLVLAIVLVNFSYFGGKVVIDVANVLTTGVFALPSAIIGEQTDYTCYDEVIGITKEQSKKLTLEQHNSGKYQIVKDKNKVGLVVDYIKYTCTVPQNIVIDFQALVDTSSNGKTDWEKVVDMSAQKPLNLKENFGSNNIALILAENVLRIRSLPQIGNLAVSDDNVSIDPLIQVFLKGAFGMLFMILYGLGFFLVAVALLGRAIYIWVFLAICPLIALLMALEGFAGIQSSVDKFSIDQFLSYVFMPVKVALVTTMAFLLIFKFNEITRETYVTEDKGTCQALGQASQAILKAQGDSSVTNSDGGCTLTNGITVTVRSAGVFSNFNDIRQLVFHGLVVIVLYYGIKWATEGAVLTSSFTNSIWDGLGKWGTTLSAGALNAVAIPYYAGDNQDQQHASLSTIYKGITNPDFAMTNILPGLRGEKVNKAAAALSDLNRENLKRVLESNPNNLLNDTSKEGFENRKKLAEKLHGLYGTKLEERFTKKEADKFLPQNYTSAIDREEFDKMLGMAALVSDNRELTDALKITGMHGITDASQMAANINAWRKKQEESHNQNIAANRTTAMDGVAKMATDNQHFADVFNAIHSKLKDTHTQNEIDDLKKTADTAQKALAGLDPSFALSSASMDAVKTLLTTNPSLTKAKNEENLQEGMQLFTMMVKMQDTTTDPQKKRENSDFLRRQDQNATNRPILEKAAQLSGFDLTVIRQAPGATPAATTPAPVTATLASPASTAPAATVGGAAPATTTTSSTAPAGGTTAPAVPGSTVPGATPSPAATPPASPAGLATPAPAASTGSPAPAAAATPVTAPVPPVGTP